MPAEIAASIPLAVRLPNPPPVFRGRAPEIATLTDLLKRGPAAVVRGPSGIGKTALALHVSHALCRRRLDAARYVRLGTEDPGAAVLRALAPPIDPEERARLHADPDALWAVVLDLAEAGRAWVVIDGDEVEDPGPLVAAAEVVARFARRSRWVVTVRAGRSAALEAITVGVGPLAEVELTAMAGEIEPRASAARIGQAVEAAAGSPGWLRWALALRAEELRDPAARAERLAAELIPALSPAARIFLRAAALVEGVLPAEMAPPLAEPVRWRLLAQGLVEARPGGFAMHAAVRELVLRATEAEAAHDGALAAALAGGDDAAGRLAALRIWLWHDEIAAALALLDAAGPALRQSGWAAELWRLLQPRTEPALAVWRMRAAVDLGDVEVLRGLALPRDEGAIDAPLRLEWARALSLRGELARALVEADAARAASDDPRLRRRATRLATRCLLNLGRFPEALARLADAPELRGPEDEALAITCRSAMGDPGTEDEARALLARLGPRLAGPHLAAPATVRAAVSLALAFYRQGRARDTATIFDAIMAEGATPMALQAPAIRVIRLALYLALGRLAEVEALLASAGPLSHSRSLWGFPVQYSAAALRLAKGDLAGLGAELGRLIALAHAEGRIELWGFAIAMIEELHLMRAEPPESVDLTDPRLPPVAAHALRVRLMVHARRGEAFAPPPPSTHRETRIYDALCAADMALAAGDPAAAGHATAARVDAEQHGLALGEAQALERLADAWLLAGRWSAAAEGSALLRRLALRMPSARFCGEADWRDAVLARPPDLATLERLAAGFDVAPTAARRSRALLGAEVALDRVDEQVLAAVRRQLGWPAIDGPTGPWQPGWGVDRPRRRVWLPDGRWVGFETRPTLWALLVALVAGPQTKEALVAAVWPGEGYHPLQHDNRLHATVRLLRKAIDDEASTRIETTEDGYRLGDHPRSVMGGPPT